MASGMKSISTKNLLVSFFGNDANEAEPPVTGIPELMHRATGNERIGSRGHAGHRLPDFQFTVSFDYIIDVRPRMRMEWGIPVLLHLDDPHDMIHPSILPPEKPTLSSRHFWRRGSRWVFLPIATNFQSLFSSLNICFLKHQVRTIRSTDSESFSTRKYRFSSGIQRDRCFNVNRQFDPFRRRIRKAFFHGFTVTITFKSIIGRKSG